jgi:hypothetical protein
MAATDADWVKAQTRLEKAAARINVAERVRLRDVKPRE